MELTNSIPAISRNLYRLAFGLAVFTIVYNIAEGVVSTFFGYEDESLALFGFGVDSFVEVVSGIGIAHMVLRIQRYADTPRDVFERTALKITGYAFYALVIGLVISSAYSLWTAHQPTTTVWGIIVSVVSLLVMGILMYSKTRVGIQLSSQAILADARCTTMCLYMSALLLVASTVYSITGYGYIDSMGALGIAWLSLKEGRECLEKANTTNSCHDDSCC